MRNYYYWCHHGESPNEPDFEFDSEDNIEIGNNEGADEMQDILQDLYPTAFDYGESHMDLESSIHDWHEEPNEEAKRKGLLVNDRICKRIKRICISALISDSRAVAEVVLWCSDFSRPILAFEVH
ncbi:hypothetical protein Ancab_019328 [Ancistrocladus abbreviatus]